LLTPRVLALQYRVDERLAPGDDAASAVSSISMVGTTALGLFAEEFVRYESGPANGFDIKRRGEDSCAMICPAQVSFAPVHVGMDFTDLQPRLAAEINGLAGY
jgi:hypothetical protein